MLISAKVRKMGGRFTLRPPILIPLFLYLPETYCFFCSLPQESFSDTVRLNTGRSGVVTLSAQK